MYKIVCILGCLLYSGISFSQDIVADTVFIDFVPDTILPVAINVIEVNDNREMPPKFISYNQTKKYLLIPVDQEISTKSPLAFELLNSLAIKNNSAAKYKIDINYFLIERHKGHFFRPYFLRVDLPIYKASLDSFIYVGMLSYNFPYSPDKKKTPLAEICEAMITEWHRDLKLDLIALNSFENNLSAMPESFIAQKIDKPHFLNVQISSVIGFNFWLLDAELYFSRPETKEGRLLMANIIRYQNNKDYEMIGVGKQSEHYIKRLSDNWSTDVNFNFILGLNKWSYKDDKTLYQLLNFSLSSSQSITYNKINESSWFIKSGFFENLDLIIETKPKPRLGIYLATGYKF